MARATTQRGHTCVEFYPVNPYVKLVTQEGIPDVMVLQMLAPADARIYIAQECNKLVGFGAVTHCVKQNIQAAPDVHKSLEAAQSRGRQCQ